eukprot:1158883-Pelagomonas_calceolata.AAC.11
MKLGRPQITFLASDRSKKAQSSTLGPELVVESRARATANCRTRSLKLGSCPLWGIDARSMQHKGNFRHQITLSERTGAFTIAGQAMQVRLVFEEGQ